jgi:hypothetical protein
MTLSAANIAELPEELRRELREALLLLDCKRAMEAINAIGEFARDRFPGLAAALKDRVQNFDYEAILENLEGPT